MHSVQTFIAPPGVLTAAVGSSSLHSQISSIRSHKFKNLLSCMAISVTFTQSITVN